MNLFVETLKNNINNQINDYILEIITINIFLFYITILILYY